MSTSGKLHKCFISINTCINHTDTKKGPSGWWQMAQCIKPTLLSQWNVSIFIPRIAIKLLSSMNEVGESLLVWLWIIMDYLKRETASKVRHCHCRDFEEIWGKFSVLVPNLLNYTVDVWSQWPNCSFVFWFLLCGSERKGLSMSHAPAPSSAP